MKIDYREIENKALETLNDFDIAEPVVDVLKIAKGLNVDVKETTMPEQYADVAGFFNKSDNTIYVNTADKPNRKLFTVAHELGHIILGHKNYGVLFRIPKEGVSYTKEEKEANAFAALLLMPRFMLIEYLDKYDLTINDYVKMAEIFGVPVVSMKTQLERLV